MSYLCNAFGAETIIDLMKALRHIVKIRVTFDFNIQLIEMIFSANIYRHILQQLAHLPYLASSKVLQLLPTENL